jgi:aminoglycoside phosphotransferase (APT) family kinase protein
VSNPEQFLPYLLRELGLPGKASTARLEPLHGSRPDSAHRLTVGDVRYVVRPGTFMGGTRDIVREFEMLKLLQGSGLAPAPVLLDPDKRFIVYEYLPGVAWSRNMLTEEGALDTLMESLVRLHSFSPAGTVLEPVKRVERYLLNAEPIRRSILTRLCAGAASKLQDRNLALCHQDLWCGNIIQGWSTRFIDWEYADGGSPLFDLATLICYHDMKDDETEKIWQAYVNKSGWQPPREDLNAWCTIVDCLTVAWCMYISLLTPRPELTNLFYVGAIARLGLDSAIWSAEPVS